MNHSQVACTTTGITDPHVQRTIRLIVPHFCRQRLIVQHRAPIGTIRHPAPGGITHPVH